MGFKSKQCDSHSFSLHYLLSRWFWYTLSYEMNQFKDKHEEASYCEEEKLKFYITSFSFCLCNSACLLQSLGRPDYLSSLGRSLKSKKVGTWQY